MPPLGVVTISCAGDFVSFVLQRADGPDLSVSVRAIRMRAISNKPHFQPGMVSGVSALFTPGQTPTGGRLETRPGQRGSAGTALDAERGLAKAGRASRLW